MAEELKRLGGNLEKESLTEEEISVIEQRKRELKRLRDKLDQKRADKFYEPIGEERKKELNEKVIQKKKLYSNTEMLKKDLVSVQEHFEHEFGEYMASFMDHETSRVNAHKNLKEIEIMQDYLQKRDEKENVSIKNITVWSQIAD